MRGRRSLEREQMQSTRPFPETLRSLLEMQGVSQRQLMDRTREQAGWGSYGTVTHLLRGFMRPSMVAMQHIAQALQVEPETFAEYRLGKARERLDPTAVGLDEALRNLDEMTRG